MVVVLQLMGLVGRRQRSHPNARGPFGPGRGQSTRKFHVLFRRLTRKSSLLLCYTHRAEYVLKQNANMTDKRDKAQLESPWRAQDCSLDPMQPAEVTAKRELPNGFPIND